MEIWKVKKVGGTSLGEASWILVQAATEEEAIAKAEELRKEACWQFDAAELKAEPLSLKDGYLVAPDAGMLPEGY